MLAPRLLDQVSSTFISGTANASAPFFSPDGEWLGFFADGKLKKVSVHGGSTVDLCAAVNPRGGSWGRDENIVFGLNLSGPLYRVTSAGGTPQAVTKLAVGEATHRWPQVLPGGEAVVFTSSMNTIGHEDANVQAVFLKTGQVKTLVRGGYFGRALPSGHLVFVRQGKLFGVAL